jgi:hypothetical protein
VDFAFSKQRVIFATPTLPSAKCVKPVFISRQGFGSVKCGCISATGTDLIFTNEAIVVGLIARADWADLAQR